MDNTKINERVIVGIHDCEVKMHIGAFEEERAHLQTIFVDIEVQIDKGKEESFKDRLENTYSYADLEKISQEVGKCNSFHLLETYGEKVLDRIFVDRKVKSAKITMRKKGVLKTCRFGFVEIVRERG